ncbi:hypothetical protein K9M78_03125 [Candidatus Bipolaricaulota bacterium]|nr:hypothetical protein [Candidatus Bipolaricaulota bacterium]
MYVKLEEEKDRYHFCREHLEEMGEGDALENSEKRIDKSYGEPEEVCEDCQDLAEQGDCHAVFVKTGSFAE